MILKKIARWLDWQYVNAIRAKETFGTDPGMSYYLGNVAIAMSLDGRSCCLCHKPFKVTDTVDDRHVIFIGGVYGGDMDGAHLRCMTSKHWIDLDNHLKASGHGGLVEVLDGERER